DVVAALVDVHRHDGVLQRGVGLVLEARRDVDRLERRLGGGLREDGGGGGGGAAGPPADTADAAVGGTHDWYTICQELRRAQSGALQPSSGEPCSPVRGPRSRFGGRP